MMQARSLLDGANAAEVQFSKEAIELSRIVRDLSRPDVERITAFEDIIDLEIGDTSLSRARNVEREIGLRQLYLKFEGGNPSGTQKDRIAFAQCRDALRHGYRQITLASCGNYGAAMSLAARLAGLEVIICIPEQFHTSRIAEMQQAGAQIVRTKGSYEESVEFSKALAVEKEYYDANPGGLNASLQFQAYSEIAFELYDILRDAPKAVAIPASNGTLLVGVYRGFVSLYKRGKTSRIPRIVAGSTAAKNPIIESFTSNKGIYEDVDPATIKETKYNEPLVNWHSFDGKEALHAIIESNGYAAGVSDNKLANCARLLKNREGLNVLPASTAGLVAFMDWHKKQALEGDRYVAILTGKN